MTQSTCLRLRVVKVRVEPTLQQGDDDMSGLTKATLQKFSTLALVIAGGEKKRNEILQMSVLDAELSILDEIDSGLDIDALKDVASAVNGLTKPETATIMVTHYKV